MMVFRIVIYYLIYIRDLICWKGEFNIDASVHTELSQTGSELSRPPVSFLFSLIILAGGKLTIQYIKKRTRPSKQGIPRIRPGAFSRITSAKRTVARPYGGTYTHEEVKDRYSLFAHV